MKIGKILFSFLFIFVLSIGFYGCTSDLNKENDVIKSANSYLTLDINPSIEIITNDEGLVVQVNGLNDDAMLLLVGNEFAGKTVDEVVDAIINLALELGYLELTADNAIVVTAESEDDEKTTELETKVNEVINKFAARKKLKMQIVNARLGANSEMKAQAKELNISVGKLKLINVAMELDDTLTLEAAAAMPVKDLNRIVIDARKEMNDFLSEEAKRNYLGLKAQLNSELRIKRVELLYQTMLEADESEFVSILENSTATVEEVKALYKSYYEEVSALMSSNAGTFEEELNNNESIIELLNTRQSLLETKKNLENGITTTQNKREIRDLLKANREELLENEDQIKNIIQDYIRNIISELVKYRYNFVEADGKLRLELHLDRIREVNEIKEKYEALFLEKGIDLEALEELFSDSINEAVKAFMDENKDKLDELKEKAKDIKSTIVEELKEKHKEFKESFGKIKK